MVKRPLSQDIGKDLKNIVDYISDDEVAKTARLICEVVIGVEPE